MVYDAQNTLNLIFGMTGTHILRHDRHTHTGVVHRKTSEATVGIRSAVILHVFLLQIVDGV